MRYSVAKGNHLCYSACHMAKKKVTTQEAAEDREIITRVYEAGYHLVPTIKEEELESYVAGIRAVVEQHGGSFIAEGAPTLLKLAYPMTNREGDKNVEYDRGYFGWLKFEASPETARALESYLVATVQIFRSMVFRTLREDTRAKIKLAPMREVKRGEALKTARKEETAAPVSEEQLDKAIEDLTTE